MRENDWDDPRYHKRGEDCGCRPDVAYVGGGIKIHHRNNKGKLLEGLFEKDDHAIHSTEMV